ncbi:MAG: hypothetical protein K6E91_06320 [Butyrivibrio sp.]|nr:hypothetical protein [Butyrivibrio sp.]
MAKTIELYYENAYLSEFDARVLSCEEGKNGNFFVVLDRTAFFPEQGGQSSDVGILKDTEGTDIRVLHTSISDGVITHTCDGRLAPDTKVTGRIDWDKRFSNMQQHTGEHIFSGLVHSRFGYENVGFHLSDNEVTMDYNGPLSEGDILDLEMSVNRAIWKNLEVKCEFPDKDELEKLDYRSKKELSGDIRIVTVPGYDVCACCAPHVSRTGEIGTLKVISCQSYKGGVRVSILCGERALLFTRDRQRIVEELVGIFTTSSDRITAAVQKLSDENSALKRRVSDLSQQLMEYELSKIDSALEDVFIVREEDIDGNLMRKMVTLLSEGHSGFNGVFAGNNNSGYKYIIAKGSGEKDLKALQGGLSQRFGAKGGGSGKMIQGSIRNAQIEEVLTFCREYV